MIAEGAEDPVPRSDVDHPVAADPRRAALEFGLSPIVCVGERLEERESGNTAAVLVSQFQKGIAGLSEQQFAKIQRYRDTIETSFKNVLTVGVVSFLVVASLYAQTKPKQNPPVNRDAAISADFEKRVADRKAAKTP